MEAIRENAAELDAAAQKERKFNASLAQVSITEEDRKAAVSKE